MSTRVPPPPQPRERAAVPVAPKSRLKLAAPLDAGFLGRTYITTLWMGTVFSICAWGMTQSLVATGSFIGGALLGALLLKSQELFVRSVIAPRSGVVEKTWISKVPLLVLLPLKYILVALTFSFFISRGWFQPVAFIAGFLMEQVVIVSKVIGRAAANQLRQNEVDVQSDVRSTAVPVASNSCNQ